MILIEARRLAIEMSITDFAGLSMHTKTIIAQKLPRLYEEIDTLIENNREEYFSSSDNDFLGFYSE
jgi:hypothetical protein